MFSGFREIANPENCGNVQHTQFYGEEVSVVAKMDAHPTFGSGSQDTPDSSSNPRRFAYAGGPDSQPDHLQAKPLCAGARGPP
eukprot:9096665-Alexandrium_andersonii.AAC.1